MHRALVAYLVAAAGGALLALTGLAAPSPWDLATVLVWAIVLSGPLAVATLAPGMRADGRPWMRRVANVLPAAMLAFVLHETVGTLVPPPSGVEATRHWARVALHGVLLAAAVPAAVLDARRMTARDRREALRWGAPLFLLVPFPDLGNLLGFATIGLQGAAVLGLLGFRRTPRAWARAAGAGAGLAVAGLGLLWIAQGAPLPPRVVTSASAFDAYVLPLLVAAVGMAGAVLLLAPDEPGA